MRTRHRSPRPRPDGACGGPSPELSRMSVALPSRSGGRAKCQQDGREQGLAGIERRRASGRSTGGRGRLSHARDSKRTKHEPSGPVKTSRGEAISRALEGGFA